MKTKPTHTNKHILDFAGATVIVWPDLEQLAVVSPFGPSSMSFDEAIREIEKTKGKRKDAGVRNTRKRKGR